MYRRLPLPGRADGRALALSSMTGPSEVWFMSSYDSYASEAQLMKTANADEALQAEIERLWRLDAQFIDSGVQIEAVARPDLTIGAFPDLGLARFFNITTIRVRIGHEQSFEAAARVYMNNARRGNPGTSYRVYQVVNGMPGINYLVLSSVNNYADLDKVTADEMSMMQSASPKDMAILQKSSSDDIQNIISNRFRVSPGMSYVAAETKAKDPAFWNKR
jgi:hypothetical protein